MTKFVMQAAIAATAGAGCLALEAALSPAAMALSFGFSFNNDPGNGGGTVTGIVRGLTEGTSAATSVEVLTNTAGFGIGEYVGNPVFNTWTILGGVLQSYEFASAGNDNTSPAVTDSTLVLLNSSEFSLVGLGRTGGVAVLDPISVAGLTFTPIDEHVDPTPIPTPALLPGLVGLGAAALRKRQTAA